MSTLIIRDIVNSFGETGGVANTSAYSNSEVFLVSNVNTKSTITSTNTAPATMTSNTPYSSLSLRSGLYGFPKNSQGNIKDSIYSLLNFESLDIGTVGGITGLNPGSDYNVDPFVLIIQPVISAFNRKDYIIEIENPTRDFITGENINQTSDNLIFYDLKVSNGVFGNNFTEKSVNLNSSIDIDSNFIYAFDGTQVSFTSNIEEENFISIADNEFRVGDALRYIRSSNTNSITNLVNNQVYFVTTSNTSGIKISNDLEEEISLSISNTNQSGHSFRRYTNVFSNNEKISYNSSESRISGLETNEIYYVVNSNNIGFSVSSEINGNVINISSLGSSNHTFRTVPGYLPGDRVYSDIVEKFNPNTDIENNSISTNNNFEDGSEVLYFTSTGNTVISGLVNNGAYFITSSGNNTVKLSEDPNGNEIILSGSVSENGHFLSLRANADIQSVYTVDGDQFVRVRNIENNFSNGNILLSYTNASVNAEIQSVLFNSITATARGIIKPQSNNTHLRVKRVNFENTFREGENILADISGAEATVVSVDEDQEVLQIGLNARVDANVITAGGQVTNLQVIDSGFGYANSEIINFSSEDGTRFGTSRTIIDGHGTGKGFYRSSKGFLSADMNIQDGDFYQEYSYEVLSKISFDRYAEVFKDVMHTAGTKFFGSILSVEEAKVMPELIQNEKIFTLSFNPSTDIDNANNTLSINESRTLSNGDVVQYVVNNGNTAIDGLSNNGIYTVSNTHGNTIQMSNNSIINIKRGSFETGHSLIKRDNN